MAWAGVAAAVSGGGYNPDQQDCTPNADAWSTTPGYTEPGCHNVAVNVQGGGQNSGDATNNTRYFELGLNQLPITNEPATPTILGVGYPGQQNSEHSGCVALDTNGTGGGTGTGCGTGTGGLGFEINFDYYNLVEPGYMDPAGLPFPVPDPTATKVNGGVPFTFTPDTNAGGVAGPGSIFNTFMTQGLQVYFGQDDNTDAGEHDGVSGVEGQCPQSSAGTVCHSAGVVNGPSDGGGMLFSIEPQWLMAPTNPTASHPEGFVNYSFGFCADGICGEGTTQQQKVYNGCVTGNGENPHAECAQNTSTNDNVYNNNTPASTQEPANCSSGDATSESCNNGSLDAYRQSTPTNMYAEPGIQTYQDPDPQRSPAAPFGTPGFYAGTCGLFLNDSGGAGSPGITGQDPGYIVQSPTGDPACSYY